MTRSRHRHALPVPPVPPPECEEDGDTIFFYWWDRPERISVSRIRDVREAVIADVQVQMKNTRPIWAHRMNLTDGRLRAEAAKIIGARDGTLPWAQVLEDVCGEVLRRRLREDMAVRLVGTPRVSPLYQLGPLLLKDEANLLYGDGDTGKSILALAIALSLTTGTGVVPGAIPVGQTAVLYADWETRQETQDDRVHALLRGAGLKDAGALYYIAMKRPLDESLTHLRSECHRLGAGVLMVDSLAVASGADPETANSAMRVFGALRQLPALTSLVIAHIAHASRDQEGARRPYGSVFVRNCPRLAWETRTAEDRLPGEPLRVGLYRTKDNLGCGTGPFGYEIAFGDGTITLAAASVKADPDLSQHLPARQRIIAAIEDGAHTNEQIAESTLLKPDTVQKTCLKLERQGRIIRDGTTHPNGGGRPSIRWLIVP